MHDVLRYTHIACGVVCLFSGLLPIITKKGGKLHRQTGRLFFWSMFGIFITALGLIFLVQFNYFLLVISVFSFYSCFTGYRVLYRKKVGEQTWIDWAGAVITLLAGLSFIYFAVKNLLAGSGLQPIVILLIVFGSLTSWISIEDMLIFQKKEMNSKMWWWYHHMNAMSGAYIAAITAFAVQMSGLYLDHLSFSWLAWVLPGMIGAPMISIAKRRYKKKFESNGL
ncbi:MAG: hypothetical protein AAFW89_08495 [Bacteroidota bacterium]